MDTLPLAYDWVFLVDADEALTPELADEIRQAIQDPAYRRLLHGAADVLSWDGRCATATPAFTSSRCFAAGRDISSAG